MVLLFLIPYTVGWSWGWWKFAASSLAIGLLWRWAKPGGFATDFGIRLHRVDVFLGGLSLLAVGIIASYLIPGVLRQHGYVPAPHSSSVWKYLAVPFQTLNEEMVLRAMLLTALAHIVKVRLATSISVAAVFMVLHFVLYLLGPPHVALSIQSLTTLFLVGLAFNEFFLATGSIAIPYGVHLGWNLTRFGNDWIDQGSTGPLREGVDFNLIEGNCWVIALAAVLALIAVAARFRPSARPGCGSAGAVALWACGLSLAGALVSGSGSCRSSRLQASVRFLGYTNFPSVGTHVGAVQVSNASPFAIVRCRSPVVMLDPPAGRQEYAPAGWAVLRPGECEQVWTEPRTDGRRWRMAILCQRLGMDSYGIGAESGFRVLQRRIAYWLEDHRAPFRIPKPSFPVTEFSSDWIEP